MKITLGRVLKNIYKWTLKPIADGITKEEKGRPAPEPPKE